jgi:hypothetical protein
VGCGDKIKPAVHYLFSQGSFNPKALIFCYGWVGPIWPKQSVRKPHRGGVNFDPPMVFCACSMQNAPAASGMLPDDFRVKKKVLPPKLVLGAQAGCGDVTSLYKNLVKKSEN